MTEQQQACETVVSESAEKVRNPIVFFDISVDDERIGRVIFELFTDVTPKTAENFRALCTGEKGIGVNGKKLHYKDSIFHKIVPQFMIQGGDIINFDGTGGESIYGPTFEDENFKLSHSSKGLLSTVNKGKPDTNNSQFIITTEQSFHLDKTNVVFGKVVKGMGVVQEISEGLVVKDKPVQVAKIIDCGEIKDGEDWGLIENDGTQDVFTDYPEDWDYALDTQKEQIDHKFVKDVIEKIKNSGNHYYGKKDIVKAGRKYEKALAYYNWLSNFNTTPSELQVELDSLKITIMLNQAMVKLKKKQYLPALELCNNVLSTDASNTKALFRRSQAYVGLCDYKLGLDDLQKLNSLDPTNKEVVQEMNKVKEMMKTYLNYEKKSFQRMFGSKQDASVV